MSQVNDTSLVVSGGVDCRRRRQNVYDKKPQRYAPKTTEHNLIVRSGRPKSKSAITNNKILRSRHCRPTVEANY